MNIVSKKFVDDKEIGSIAIADEVIATIAGTAALEAKGVFSTPTMQKGAIINWINKRNLSKDVMVSVEDNEIYVNISIIVDYGYKIQEVSYDVQDRIKNALEIMTGMVVKEVNVTVEGVVENASVN